MSQATTLARLLTVIGGVAGITGGAGKVHDRIRDDLDRPDAETHLMGSVGVNCWEVCLTPRYAWGGASGMQRATGHVRLVAHYLADDATDSRATFAALLEVVFAALMVPTTGFPQITEEGIRVVAWPDVPVKLRTGHAAYRAEAEFDLWDLEHT